MLCLAPLPSFGVCAKAMADCCADHGLVRFQELAKARVNPSYGSLQLNLAYMCLRRFPRKPSRSCKVQAFLVLGFVLRLWGFVHAMQLYFERCMLYCKHTANLCFVKRATRTEPCSAEFVSRFGLPPMAQVNHVQLPDDMALLLSFLSAMGPEEALLHFVDSGGGGTRGSLCSGKCGVSGLQWDFCMYHIV